MPISALPTPPSRQDPTNFNDRADAFLGALPLFQSEANTLEINVNTREQNTISASNAALAVVDIVKWVSNETYNNGQAVWSPINGLGYRRITALGFGSTDPSLDTTNYAQISGTGNVSTTGNQTIGGVKTFSSNIVGNITGNAATATTATTASTATTANTATALTTASGSAPSYSARAWVNFNGQGTVSIRSSGNVSSITDTNQGIYRINFTTAMSDANYAVSGMVDLLPAGYTCFSGGLAVGWVFIYVVSEGFSAYSDPSNVSVVIHR